MKFGTIAFSEHESASTAFDQSLPMKRADNNDTQEIRYVLTWNRIHSRSVKIPSDHRGTR
jgi:hypothetical protein